MRFLRSLVAVIIVGWVVLLGQGWRSTAIREEQLEKRLTHEHLMRIGDSALQNLYRQVVTPNEGVIADLERIVWEMCLEDVDVGVDRTPFSTTHTRCAFTPKLRTYQELIQDFPLHDVQKRSEHINALLMNRQIDVTILGFDVPRIFPVPDGRGQDFDGTRFFDPVVKVKFQMHTWPIASSSAPSEPEKVAAWIKFTEPTYEFPVNRKR